MRKSVLVEYTHQHGLGVLAEEHHWKAWLPSLEGKRVGQSQQVEGGDDGAAEIGREDGDRRLRSGSTPHAVAMCRIP